MCIILLSTSISLNYRQDVSGILWPVYVLSTKNEEGEMCLLKTSQI